MKQTIEHRSHTEHAPARMTFEEIRERVKGKLIGESSARRELIKRWMERTGYQFSPSILTVEVFSQIEPLCVQLEAAAQALSLQETSQAIALAQQAAEAQRSGRMFLYPELRPAVSRVINLLVALMILLTACAAGPGVKPVEAAATRAGEPAEENKTPTPTKPEATPTPSPTPTPEKSIAVVYEGMTKVQLNIRKEPNATSDRLGALAPNTRFEIQEVGNGWGKLVATYDQAGNRVAREAGFISLNKDYVTLAEEAISIPATPVPGTPEAIGGGVTEADLATLRLQAARELRVPADEVIVRPEGDTLVASNLRGTKIGEYRGGRFVAVEAPAQATPAETSSAETAPTAEVKTITKAEAERAYPEAFKKLPKSFPTVENGHAVEKPVNADRAAYQIVKGNLRMELADGTQLLWLDGKPGQDQSQVVWAKIEIETPTLMIAVSTEYNTIPREPLDWQMYYEKNGFDIERAWGMGFNSIETVLNDPTMAPLLTGDPSSDEWLRTYGFLTDDQAVIDAARVNDQDVLSTQADEMVQTAFDMLAAQNGKNPDGTIKLLSQNGQQEQFDPAKGYVLVWTRFPADFDGFYGGTHQREIFPKEAYGVFNGQLRAFITTDRADGWGVGAFMIKSLAHILNKNGLRGDPELTEIDSGQLTDRRLIVDVFRELQRLYVVSFRLPDGKIVRVPLFVGNVTTNTPSGQVQRKF